MVNILLTRPLLLVVSTGHKGKVAQESDIYLIRKLQNTSHHRVPAIFSEAIRHVEIIRVNFKIAYGLLGKNCSID